jgi:pimeloyl-ACP methyl ester carboxylesterase
MSEPFYFGSDQALWGLYCPPNQAVVEQIGVILCYPFGQEYIRCHRGFMHLARQCASQGLHVLRFDFWGCGDSYGDHAHATIARWIENISTAIQELRANNIERIYLVGLRLGAMLATLCGVQRQDIEGIVLWDSIINGYEYVRTLKKSHQQWLHGSFVSHKASSLSESIQEICGFAVSTTMIHELECLDLLGITQLPAEKIFILETQPHAQQRKLCKRFQTLGVDVTYKQLSSFCVWIKTDNNTQQIPVPTKILNNIVTWITLGH